MTSLRYKVLTAVATPCGINGSPEMTDQNKCETRRRNPKDNQQEIESSGGSVSEERLFRTCRRVIWYNFTSELEIPTESVFLFHRIRIF
jgi:hypothetical protein